MNAPEIKALVFDADGTLFDTERLGLRVWTEVGRRMGLPQPAQHYMQFLGLNRDDGLALMAQLFGADFPSQGFFAQCSRYAMEVMQAEGVPVKAGAREILQFLQQRQIPVGLATSTHMDRTLYRMERTGLGQYFQTMTTGDQVLHSKPDPEIFALACRSLGVEPGAALAVEDSRNGILSAHGAGLLPVMIPDLLPPAPDILPMLFRQFDSLLELRDYLAEIL